MQSVSRSLLIKLVIIGVVAIAIVSQLVLSFSPMNTFRAGGLSFEYPKEYVKQATGTSEDGSTQLLNSLRSDPMSVLSVHSNFAPKRESDKTKISLLEYLEKTSNDLFKKSYKDYEKKSFESVKLSGHDAGILTFSYTGQDQKTKITMKYIMLIDDPVIHYITMQSFDEKSLNKDAEIVLDSIEVKS